MDSLFNVIKLNYKDKNRILVTEAHSQVKSKKYFPIYTYNNKKMIFKPLSKTKPLTTPLFAYSEVYWSYIINKYFDSTAPRYYLAISKDIEKENPKYYEKGVLVDSINPNGEKIINLYDYFIDNPEENIDIKDYVNYCMKNYDYTKILLSNFINKNKYIGEEIAYQILLSILRQDQNFHYENINFIETENSLSVAPPIDFEFSTPFLYPDQVDKYEYEKNKYINLLKINYEEDEIEQIIKKLKLNSNLPLNNTIVNNICLIVKLYPNIVLKFIKNCETLLKDLPDINLDDPDNYIDKLNSDYWEVGHALFKENNFDKYEELKNNIKLVEIDKTVILNRIKKDILEFSKYFNLILKIYLFSYKNGIEDLENLTIKRIIDKLNIDSSEKVEIIEVDIDRNKIKLKK